MLQGFTVWLTGLSGSGKSTIAQALAASLTARGCRVEILDGDEMRSHLSRGLGYTREDRDVNIARIAYVAALLTKHGAAVITAAISPYADARRKAREHIGTFIEVYVRCSLPTLVARDAKGLYARAIRGELDHFTGISDPYEAPINPDVTVDTEDLTLDHCVAGIIAELETRGLIAAQEEITA